jgi:hypothetical protein
MRSSSTIPLRLSQSMTLHPKLDWGVLVLASTFFASTLLCWSVMSSGPKLTLAVAIVPLVLPFMVAYAAMTEQGFLDPTAMFPAVFAAYNGVPLVRFLSEEVRQHLTYPVKFEPETFFRAGLLSALGAIFIAITWALAKPPTRKTLLKPDLTGWFEVGTAFYAFGILLYLLQYMEIGGYWAALAISRPRRFEIMRETLSLPYFGFVLVGLVMNAAASGQELRKKVATILMTTLWCGMVMAQGDRRLFLQTVLAILGVRMFLGLSRTTRLRLKHLVFVFFAYAALAVAGQFRELIPGLVASTRSDQQKVIYSGNSNSWLASLEPGNSELGGPFLSVLYNAEQVKEYLLGTSYLETIPTILPRIIYPSKPPSLETLLSNEVSQSANFGFPVAGWGYSPIAEAFLNFGFVGVCLISSLWMGAFVVLNRLRDYRWGIVTAAVFAPESINANRIDFRTVYLEVITSISAIVLAIFVVKTLYQRSSRPLRHRVTEERTLS